MKKDMKSKKADKLRGFLCRSADRQYFFRTYNEDGTFTDYNLFHPDLEIQILDSDAYIYKKNGEYCIDCGPQTLGLENEDDYSQQLQYFSKKSEKCDELKSGKAKGIPGDEVFNKIWKRFPKSNISYPDDEAEFGEVIFSDLTMH